MSDKELIEKEKGTYLKLVLLPLGLLIVLNAIFQVITYDRLNSGSWVYFLVSGVALTVVYAYATYRMGKALDLGTEQWTITVMLFALLFWGSFIYILITASRLVGDEG